MLFWIWVFVCLICWEVGWQPNEGLLHHNTNGSCFCGSGCIFASTLKGSPPKNKKKLEIFQTFFYPLLGYCAAIATNSTAQVMSKKHCAQNRYFCFKMHKLWWCQCHWNVCYHVWIACPKIKSPATNYSSRVVRIFWDIMQIYWYGRFMYIMYICT